MVLQLLFSFRCVHLLIHFSALLQVVRGAVAGASISAFKAQLNFGALTHTDDPGEAAKHCRIVLAYLRYWPHKDAHEDLQACTKELVLHTIQNLCAIDRGSSAARRRGEEAAAEHFRALEDSDPLALFFRGHSLLCKLLLAGARRDPGVAAEHAPNHAPAGKRTSRYQSRSLGASLRGSTALPPRLRPAHMTALDRHCASRTRIHPQVTRVPTVTRHGHDHDHVTRRAHHTLAGGQ